MYLVVDKLKIKFGEDRPEQVMQLGGGVIVLMIAS